MKNEYLEGILSERRGSKYDVAVMYSGGKDSSYLLYLLKEVYHLRVVAVCVDNGYEYDDLRDRVGKFTDKMGVELEIIKPSNEFFAKFFKTVIVENEYFAKPGVNHVCFVCNNILWCTVMKYAAENDIPYVASGLSLMQLSSGRPYPLEPNKLANSIAEKSTKQVLRNAIDGFMKTNQYKEDEMFRDFIDALGRNTSTVKTIYPYIYHQISVEELKGTLEKFGWQPPSHVSVEEYISSGCKIMSNVVSELEKLGMITLNEREQAKAMMEAGLLNQDDYEFANYDASKDVVRLTSPLIREIGVKDYLKQKCIEMNRTFVE